ncbi:DUF6318 family protein [Nocardioides halotolerans]|uniref:DUF6318 family protein n=1 Tax=Nocardioides halotolerans TaxID=433660 RepID=UPI0012FA93A6|nr:DUF6318 family protein [Nocardioides halotolerans]
MTRTRAALAALVAACLLGACSDDDPEPDIPDPTPSVTSSSPATVSPTSGSPEPVLDPEETVGAWVSARNAALQSGDTSAVEDLSSAACETCEDSIDPIREVFDQGGHFETAGWKVLASEIASQTPAKAEVSAGIEYAAGKTFPNSDSPPVIYDSEKHIVQFRLALVDGAWRVSFIGYLS